MERICVFLNCLVFVYGFGWRDKSEAFFDELLGHQQKLEEIDTKKMREWAIFWTVNDEIH